MTESDSSPSVFDLVTIVDSGEGFLLITGDGFLVPIYSWCHDLEEETLKQLINLAKLPFLIERVAEMPDGHKGYGMPIGGVIACDGTVIPNAVGVDIGCGMHAVRTDLFLKDLTTDILKALMGRIRSLVPTGMNWHKKPVRPLDEDPTKGLPVVMREYKKATLQLGTLGGGNHFIEIQKDEEGRIWFMIHSGSRNIGKQIAEHYNKIAKELNKRWHTRVDPKWDLAFLPIEEQEAKNYMSEMQYAVDFALRNREVMSELVKEAVFDIIGSVSYDPAINIAHNYAAWENIKGKNVLVHRKGATSARAGQIGIIPGSQGSSSYIVEGLGNVKSFYSCSHGAGRLLGRKDAQRKLNLQEEIERLDKLGVIHGMRTQKDLDEAPSAYKDIDTVMENQKDLVKIVTKLTPLAVIKEQ